MDRYLQLATCLILLACVAMVSAETFDNIDQNIVINQIKQNHTIYFGEENLDVTDCLGGNGYAVTLDVVRNVTDSIRIDNPLAFTMPTDKEENTWYQASDANTPVLDLQGNPVPAFITQEPVLSFDIWNLNSDMKAAPQVQRGSLLQFKFTTQTNLDDIRNRFDYDPDVGYMNIGVVAPDGEQLLQLMTLGRDTGDTLLRPTINLNVQESAGWVWPDNLNSKTADPTGWMTGWRDAGSGQETDYNYKVGSYDVTALCNVNNLFKNNQQQGVTWDAKQVELTPREVTVSVSAPTGKSRDAQFTATVTGMPSTSYEIFIFDECPPRITGQICDRPPFIVGDRADLLRRGIELDPIDGPYAIGSKLVVDCCTQGMNIRQAVPSGDAFPSQGSWDIFEEGTRYYAKVTTGQDGVVTVPFWIDTTVMPGTFTVQAQDILYNQKSTAEITVPLGAITAAVKDPAGLSKPGNVFFLGDEIWIDGTNSDSNMTYIWLTGPGLEKCGVNLFNPTESVEPVKAVVFDTKDGIANYWRVEPNWNTGTVPIGAGKYTLWMASVDPGCRFCQCDPSDSGSCGFGDCFGIACEEGVCSLLNCPECAAVTSIDITLIEPDLTAEVDDVTRCCCPGYPCGQLGGVQEIWVTGASGGNSCKTLQVWLFGQSQFGLKNYLMAVTPIYCDGTYKFELNKGLLQAYGIDLCSIATGKYDVIVQAPGANNLFDIRLSERDLMGDVFVLTTIPTGDSKLFKIEGKNALYGGVAVKALIEGLNNPAVDDLYAHATFELKDKACEGNVDFTADKTIGNAPLSVQFTDLSVMDGVSWSWSRNGEVFSSEQNPRVVFEEVGKYTIKFDVTDADGNSNSAVKESYINVIAAPIGDFSYAPQMGRIGEPVQFTDQSTGSPTSWMWEFGDGSISSLQSPAHAYDEAGSYEVTLMVGNAMGIGTPVKKTITIVNDAPVAGFTAVPRSSDTYPVSVTFTDTSTGVVSGWFWQIMREGVVVATSTEKNPVITFTVPGIYSVSLTVTNNGGSDTLVENDFITIGTGSQFSITQGWNHVSVPKGVTENYDTVAELFAGINTGGVPYAVFNNAANEWVNVTDEYPVKPLEALRVFKTDPGSMTLTPTYVEDGVYTRELRTGWNGIGIMAMQPTPANVALASLGDTWVKTLLYNPVSQRWEYPIIRGVDDDKSMYPTVGYLIEMSSDGILIGGES